MFNAIFLETCPFLLSYENYCILLQIRLVMLWASFESELFVTNVYSDVRRLGMLIVVPFPFVFKMEGLWE